MATPDPAKIAQALAAELSNIERINSSTTQGLIDQEDAMKKVAKEAARAKISFNAITHNIGESVKQSSLFEINQNELNTLLSNRSIAEKNLLQDIQKQVKITDKLEELDNILKLSSKDKTKEKEKQLNELKNEYQLGKKTTEEYQSELKLIKEKFSKTRKLKEETELILNKNEDQQELSNNYLKNISKEISKRVTINKLHDVSNKMLGNMGDLGKHISELKFPDWSDVLKKGLENFIDYDKAAFGLRKNMGILRGDFNVLQNNVKTLGIELQDLGVIFEQIALATTAIANEFNMFVASNKELVKDISVVSAQLGIAENDSAKFLKTMAGIGNTTVTSQKGMIGFAKSMSNAAGIPLPAIMKDVAEASDDIRIFTGKSALNLVKSAIEARQMGTTLQNMANSAKKMLDFQTSISDEMEASVLLGKDINFQQARNLAYRKDIVGANKAILDIAKKVDFDAMDPYQAEAFAKASGKSVQELQEMLQADKEISWIRQNGTVDQKAQLEKMEQMKRMREDEAKDVGKMAEQRLREQANQERIAELQNKFNQMISELAQPIMDIVNPLMDIAIKILPSILSVTKILIGVFSALSMGTFIGGVLAIGGAVYEIYNKWKDITSAFESGDWWGGILIGLNAIGNGIIKGLLSPFNFVFNWINEKFMGNSPSEIGLGILDGIKSVGGMILDALILPFKTAFNFVFNWIKEKFMGNSPSEIGLGILDGIKSVGGMILDALTLPFRTAFNFISGLFNGPKLPKMSEIAFGNENKASTTSAANKTDIGTIIAEGNKQVVAKLDELIGLLQSGAIAVNIDGSKASTLLTRAQKERGLFGAI